MVDLSDVQHRNFLTARAVLDGWAAANVPTDVDIDAWWVRLVAALWTESQCRILAHTGTWGGGGWINAAQRAVLVTSAQWPHDGFGSNGGSVGALQQIPTPVARLATDRATGAFRAWDGWGTIPDCMALETSIPKFLAQLRVTNDPDYQGKQMASAIVADLLRVQQPLACEVAVNYGAEVTATAQSIAATYGRSADSWLTAAAAAEIIAAIRR